MKTHLIDIVKKRLTRITNRLLTLEREEKTLKNPSAEYARYSHYVTSYSEQKELLESILMQYLKKLTCDEISRGRWLIRTTHYGKLRQTITENSEAIECLHNENYKGHYTRNQAVKVLISEIMKHYEKSNSNRLANRKVSQS